MIEGYVVLEDCMFGGPLIWNVQEDPSAPIMPEIWETEEAAQKDIIVNYIEHLQQFVDGEREWEHTDMCGPNEYVAEIVISGDESMTIFTGSSINDFKVILSTTLSEWRKQL